MKKILPKIIIVAVVVIVLCASFLYYRNAHTFTLSDNIAADSNLKSECRRTNRTNGEYQN